MDLDLNNNLQHKLKDFQVLMLSAVEKMITTKMNILIIAMQKSTQLNIFSIMKQSINTTIPPLI